MLNKSNMLTLTSEITKVANFARLLPYHSDPKKKESAIQFLVSLDFLIKGNMTHSQVKLFEESAPDSSAKALMKNIDIKYPILLGD